MEVMESMKLLRQRPKTRQNPKDKSGLLKIIASQTKNSQHQARNRDFVKVGRGGWTQSWNKFVQKMSYLDGVLN